MALRLADALLIGLLVAVTAGLGRADEEFTELTSSARRMRRSADVMTNKTLNIVTILVEPFTMLKTGANASLQAGGELDYEGFIPDVIHALSRRLRFNYRFYIVPDGKYGLFDSATGKWNGMIGECVKNEGDSSTGADMAAAPITISPRREQVVDFVKPFMHFGLTVLIKRPNPDVAPGVYPLRFLAPLTPAVWGLLALAILGVGSLLWLMNRYNPYEWGSDAGLASNKDQSEAFNLPGSLWFVVTSLFWQGFERSPRSIASRVLSASWFLFVLILLLSYAASLINLYFWAGIVRPNRASQFHSLGELVRNSDFKVGAVSNGQTYRYIMDVAVGYEFDIVRRAWNSPEGQKLLVSNTVEGVNRARAEKFAFITESSTAKFVTQQTPCDLTTVGDVFALRSYGFALPNNSAYLEPLSVAVLELMEEGEIDAIERKWWYEKGQCSVGARVDPPSLDGAVSALYQAGGPRSADLRALSSAFLLLLAAMVVSVLVGAAELLYFRKFGQFAGGSIRAHGPQLTLNADESNM